MAKTPEEMGDAMVANMKDKTGKTLVQWLKITRGSKLAKHGQIVAHLKSEHGMTHGFANLVAHKTLESDAGSAASAGDLVEAQYGGAKSNLRPIYDAIIKATAGFGGDVEVSPKKAYVSLRRGKQFAIVQPSTKTRVDVGINLKGHDAIDRLELSGSFNGMVSHRVRLESLKQVDKQLIAWLKAAYAEA